MKIEGAAIAGVGQIKFDMYKDTPTVELARDAGLLALHDAGMTLADIDEVFVGYLGLAHQVGVKAVKEFGLTGLPVTHIENASATGLFAYREAAWAVASGRAEVAMALCFDKMTEMTAARVAGGNKSPRRRPRPARRVDPAGGVLRDVGAAAHARLRHDAGDLRQDRGEELEPRRAQSAVAPPARSHRHRRRSARVAHDRRAAHGDDVVPGRRRRGGDHRRQRRVGPQPSSRPTGGAPDVVGRAERGVLARSRVPRPGGRSGDDDRRPPRNEAYEQAGVGPDDVSLAMCHDAFANEELEYYELLGFCEPGEGDKLVDAGETSLGGRIPFNTDGGLIARGHPGGPTGAAMVHEIVLQLRGEAGARQVEGARIGLAHCVGGGSVCTVNLFEGVD